MATIHIIPFDDDQQQQTSCSKKLKLTHSSNNHSSNGRSSGSHNSNGSQHPTQHLEQYHHVPAHAMQEHQQQQRSTLLNDALLALEDVKSLTETIGSSIVMQEALQVNKRIIDVQNRRQMNRKRSLATSTSSDSSSSANVSIAPMPVKESISASSSSSNLLLEGEGDEDVQDFSLESLENHRSVKDATINAKKSVTGYENVANDDNSDDDDVISETERRSILRQACRMKRVTNMFRNLQRLQSILIREVQMCMIDEEEAIAMSASSSVSSSAAP